MCDTGAYCHDGFVKSTRAFKIFDSTIHSHGNGSTDSAYVNGERESHFSSPHLFRSQQVNAMGSERAGKQGMRGRAAISVHAHAYIMQCCK